MLSWYFERHLDFFPLTNPVQTDLHQGELHSAASASSHDHGCHSGPSAFLRFIDHFVSGKVHSLGSDIPRSFLAQPISLFIHIPTKFQLKVSNCVQLKECWGNRIMLVPCKCLSDILSPASGKGFCPVLRNSFRLHVSRSFLVGSHITPLSIPSLHSSSSPSYFSFLGFSFTKSAPH